MECGMDLMVFPLLLQHVNQKLWIAFVLRRDIANCGFLEALRSKFMSLHMIDKGLWCWATTLTQVKNCELRSFWVKSGPESTDGWWRMGGYSSKTLLWRWGRLWSVWNQQRGRSRKASLLGPSGRRQPCPHAECRFCVVLSSRGMADQVSVVFKSPSLW